MADPLREIASVEGVEGVYLFSSSGASVAESRNSPAAHDIPFGGLRDFLRYLAESSRNLSEVAVFYHSGFLFFRVIDDFVLLAVGGPKANPSLLRVAVDVAQYRWKDKGMDKVFRREQRSRGWRLFKGRE